MQRPPSAHSEQGFYSVIIIIIAFGGNSKCISNALCSLSDSAPHCPKEHLLISAHPPSLINSRALALYPLSLLLTFPSLNLNTNLSPFTDWVLFIGAEWAQALDKWQQQKCQRTNIYNCENLRFTLGFWRAACN